MNAVRRWSGLVRFETRALRGLALSLSVCVALAIATGVAAVPVHLAPLTLPHYFAATALTLLCGLPLVAQAFESSERGSALSILRSAPVSSASAALAKLTATALWWSVLWTSIVLASGVALALSATPGEHAIDLAATFDLKGNEVFLCVPFALVYSATALAAHVGRHALAATFAGPMISALPWVALRMEGGLSGIGDDTIGGWSAYFAWMFGHPEVWLLTLLVVLPAVRLRGPAARSTPRRALHVTTWALLFSSIVPATAVAGRVLTAGGEFGAAGQRLTDVSVRPDGAELCVVTYRRSTFPSTSIWKVDPYSGEATRLPDPSMRPLHFAPIQSLSPRASWARRGGQLSYTVMRGATYRNSRMGAYTDEGPRDLSFASWRRTFEPPRAFIGPHSMTSGAVLRVSPSGRFVLIEQKRAPEALLFDLWRMRITGVSRRADIWTKRGLPLLERTSNDGSRWILHGFGEPVELELELRASWLMDLDGTNWIARTPDGELFLLGPEGDVVRQLF